MTCRPKTYTFRAHLLLLLSGAAAVFGPYACGAPDGEQGDGDISSPLGGAGGAELGGDGDGDGDGYDGLGGAPGIALPDKVVGPKGRAFEPEGLSLNYTGEDDGGLKIISYTLHQSYGVLERATWHVAVRNDGGDPICSVSLRPGFYDATGVLVGEANGANDIYGRMHMVDGEPESCLSPGDVGMGELEIFDEAFDLSRVTRIDYGVSGVLRPSAAPTDKVKVISLTEELVYGEHIHFVGSLQNGHATEIESPRVRIFALDDLGRPVGSFFDIELITLAPGGQWEIFTTVFDGDYTKFVVYLDYRYPFDL
jgi:hypothetical protein